MHRRRFLQWLLAAPAGLLAACGSADTTSYPSVGTTGTCSGVMPDAMDFHTHPLCIPQALLDAPADAILTLEDSGLGHSHTVSLTAAQLASIAGNSSTVQVISSPAAAHSHTVTFLP